MTDEQQIIEAVSIGDIAIIEEIIAKNPKLIILES